MLHLFGLHHLAICNNILPTTTFVLCQRGPAKATCVACGKKSTATLGASVAVDLLPYPTFGVFKSWFKQERGQTDLQ